MEKKIQEIGKRLTTIGKSKCPFTRFEELKKVLKAAEGFNWLAFVEEVEAQLGEARDEVQRLQDELFGKLKSEGTQKGVAVQRMNDYIRVGPLRVRHKGNSIEMLVGNLPWRKIEAGNPAGTVKQLLQMVSEAQNPNVPFDNFFQIFRSAYKRVVDDSRSRDGWVRLDLIYREFFLEQLRQKFGETPKKSPAKISPYNLADFVLDFARFLSTGEYPSDERIKHRTPPMSQMNKVILVPELRPTASAEKQWVDVRIERRS